MALSQLQCLDDNHVNPRTTESKPEFQYCENQRLGLETLLADGREAFGKFLEDRGLRGFLSDLEQDTLTREKQPFDPDTDLYPEGADENEPPLSQDYWPEMSDQSIPQMDLGWPDSEAYRGVTRTTVYSQPPQEGQAHIKEIVRKMIAQAQKVIAVVMDVFTDVDIFRDLLDTSFKKKVSVYILVEDKMLPHFLAMCHRADMHAGHLKNLRVRCTGGREFYTRSCTKVCGRMGHRFMFIDGDKAVSGSYSFTWMSSRLDRNLITVVTGQAVDAFDRLFQCLYMASSYVDLQSAATKPEPLQEPVPQRAPPPPVSAAIARKLHNPKYSLVVGMSTPSPTPPANQTSPDESQNKTNSQKNDPKKGRRKRGHEPIVDPPPLHPGLVDLEKARLVEYLPTWPEPDPSSDVIGFINIVDNSRQNQVHLQRSERSVSQAIKFRSPMVEAKAKNPEVNKQSEKPESAQDTTVKNTPEPQSSEAETKSDKGPKTLTSQPLESLAHAASASPSRTSDKVASANSETLPKSSAPTKSPEQESVHTENLKTDTISTTKNDTSADKTNKKISNSHSEESPPQPPEIRNSLPVKSSNPSSAPEPIVTPPIPKPRTVHLPIKVSTTNGSTNTEIKKANNSTGRDSSIVPDTGEHNRNNERPKNNDHKGNLETNLKPREQESSPGLLGDGTVMHNGIKETQECPREKPINIDTKNIPDSIPREVKPSESESCNKVQAGQVANIKSNVIADQVQTKVPTETVQSATQHKLYQAKTTEPQVISYGGQNVTTGNPSSVKHNQSPLNNTTPACDVDTQRKVALRLPTTSENNLEKEPGRPQHLPLAERQVPDPPVRSQYTFRRIPTPDESCTSTTDSRTTTPDSGPFTPGYRTPVSDGYVSSKDDSTLSTNSDEYYECSDSLFNEWFFDRNTYHGHGVKDDPTNASPSSPIYMNCTSQSPIEKQEKTIEDVARRKRNSEASSPEIDGTTSPKVTQKPPQVPKRKKLPDISPEISPNSRKISSSVEWQVLIPNSIEKSEQQEEIEGKKEEANPRPLQQPRPPRPVSSSHLLTPHPNGGQPQNPVEMMLLKNSARTPPSRPPPPQGSRVDDPAAPQDVTRARQLLERQPPPKSNVAYRRMNLQHQQSAQMKSENEERKHDEGRAPFSITFGKLHKLTALKDKIGKKSASSATESRKSTS